MTENLGIPILNWVSVLPRNQACKYPIAIQQDGMIIKLGLRFGCTVSPI